MSDFGLTPPETKIFKKLNSPVKIQDFLDTIKINFEKSGDTLKSPRALLQTKSAHCMEAALFAAAVLWFHGHKPLLLDLQTTDEDFDHVVALFRMEGKWGAISKSNHNVLRYRDPVYSSVRELAMSYFHEYFLNNGLKTLRAFSKEFNLAKYGIGWITSNEDLWRIGDDLDQSPHYKILESKTIKKLRPVNKIEIKAGNIEEWKP